MDKDTKWDVKVWFIEEEIEGNQYCYGDDTYYVKANSETEALELAFDQCWNEFDDENGTWDMEIIDAEAHQTDEFYEKCIEED